ncbi:MAG: phytanoyl-CoA dioxygenase family protein [Pseudomonadota bacterium]
MSTSVSDNISDPISTIPSLEELPVAERAPKDMPGRPGNMPVEGVQGFGLIKHHPPPFDPVAQFDEAFAFYEEHGYVVVDQLSDDEIRTLNSVCDEFHEERGAEIDVPNQGQLFFPLLNYPEFDGTVFHPKTLPLVGRILGGAENVRHIEFNYRGWQPETSDYGMVYHPDDCSGGKLTLAQRQTRQPYGPPDMLSTFTYLTDVDDTTPSFAVVPKSRRTHNIQLLRDALGDEYCEVPIQGKAGTCCIVDRSTVHTRHDPFEKDVAKQGSRRILHHVFARAGELKNADGSLRTGNGLPLAVTTWAFSRGLIPKRLARSDDPEVARMFSLWPSHQQEWMATDFDEDFVSDPKSARGPTKGPYRNDGSQKE